MPFPTISPHWPWCSEKAGRRLEALCFRKTIRADVIWPGILNLGNLPCREAMFLSFVVSPSLWYFGMIVNLSWCVPLSQLHTSLPHCSWVILPTDTWVAECLTAHNSFGSYFIILIYIHFTWLFISKTVLSKTDRLQNSRAQWLTDFGYQTDCSGAGGTYETKKKLSPLWCSSTKTRQK